MSINVVVGGEVSGALRGLSAVEKSILLLQNQLTRLQKIASQDLSFKQLERVGGLIQKTQSQLSSLSRVDPGLNRLTTTSNQATASLINLGRVAQDAPYGFLGIANNLNPLLESFQRLKQTTGSAGGAFKALGSSLAGAGGIGIALSVVSSLLIVFGDRLFGSAKRVSTLSLELANLKLEADRAEEAFEALNSELDYLQKIGSLTVDFNFTDDATRSALKASQASIILDEKVLGLNERLSKLKSTASSTFDLFQQKASSTAQDFQRDFPSVRDIPESAIGDFSKKDQELLKGLIGAYKDVFEVEKELTDLTRDQSFARATIRLTNVENSRKALEKAKAEWEKYVNDTINKGKTLASFFKDTKVVPQFTAIDTVEEQFNKAIDLINTLNQEGFGDNLAPIIFKVNTPVQLAFDPSKFKFVILGGEVKTLQEEMNEFISNQNLKLAPSGIQVSFKTVIDANNKEIKDMGDRLRELASLGAFIGNSIANGFSRVFDAIASGQSVLKAFGEAVKQVVLDLIQAAIRAFIIRSITNLFAPGLGSAGTGGLGALFGGLSGRSAGGPVGANQPYVVGEAGRELFIPSTSGRIIPNNQLSSIQGAASQLIQVMVTGRIEGRDLALVEARQTRYTTRNA